MCCQTQHLTPELSVFCLSVTAFAYKKSVVFIRSTGGKFLLSNNFKCKICNTNQEWRKRTTIDTVISTLYVSYTCVPAAWLLKQRLPFVYFWVVNTSWNTGLPTSVYHILAHRNRMSLECLLCINRETWRFFCYLQTFCFLFIIERNTAH